MGRIKHLGREDTGRPRDGGREQEPERLEVASDDPRYNEEDRCAKAGPSRDIAAQGSTTKRDVASWVNWQSALYLFILGWMCVFLVPLTSFWWIVPVLGAVVPITLAMLDRPILRRPDDRKVKEQELLQVLAA